MFNLGPSSKICSWYCDTNDRLASLSLLAANEQRPRKYDLLCDAGELILGVHCGRREAFA